MTGNFLKSYVYPIATFSGGIIGVGFLSLPYIALQVGMGWMLLYSALFVALVIGIHAMYATIALHTPDFKRFPGFVGFHFGKPMEALAVALVVTGVYGSLLVYIIIGSQFLVAVFGGSVIVWALVYFALAAALVFLGIKLVSRIEFWALVMLLLAVALIFFKGFSSIHFANFFLAPHKTGWSGLLLAFGPLVFSLWGTGLIPEIEEMMQGQKAHFKRVIFIGTLIPAIFYLLFVVIILGITGPTTTESALVGIRNFLGDGVISLALLIGVIPTFIAFITQGLTLKESFKYDLGFKEFPAWVFAVFPPMILFLAGITYFIGIISFIGVFLLSIDAILILLMYLKIKNLLKIGNW